MADDSKDPQRQRLLDLLFGKDIPPALEGQLLRTSDVAALFQVSERTVSEWAKRGHIPSVRTPGGHRRYPAEGIRWLLHQSRQGPAEVTKTVTKTGGRSEVTQLPRRANAG